MKIIPSGQAKLNIQPAIAGSYLAEKATYFLVNKYFKAKIRSPERETVEIIRKKLPLLNIIMTKAMIEMNLPINSASAENCILSLDWRTTSYTLQTKLNKINPLAIKVPNLILLSYFVKKTIVTARAVATRAENIRRTKMFDSIFCSFSGFFEISRTATENSPRSASTTKKLMKVVIVLNSPTPFVPR